MSRVAKNPITILDGVTLNADSNSVNVKGKLGEMSLELSESISLEIQDNTASVKYDESSKQSTALAGTSRALINNMVIGVSEQFQLNLTLNGVGYRAAVQGKSIVLNLGYSHPVEMEIPEGISIEVQKNTGINLKACDKEQLGLFASKIRAWRPPEPYKGKGIIYEGEIVKRKAGKSGKK